MKTRDTRKEISLYFWLEGINHTGRTKTTPEEEGIDRLNLLHTMNIGYEVDDNKYFVRGSFRAKPSKYFEIPITADDMISWTEQMVLMKRVSFFNQQEVKALKKPGYSHLENDSDYHN